MHDIFVQDPKLLAALQESRKRQAPYCGAFLLKDEPGTDPSVVTGSESEKNIGDLKGKDLYNRLHEVGTLAQVLSFVPNFFFPFATKSCCFRIKQR
jgi:Lon-like ATP-dependent protease